MRRIVYVVMALLPVVGASAVAQAPGNPDAASAVAAPGGGAGGGASQLPTLRTPAEVQPATRVTPDDVVARLMAFDRDGNTVLEKEELAERMRPLLARADTNRDGVLVADEIRDVASASDPGQFGHVIPFGGQYGFADESSLSTRTHIDGVLEDMRIAPSVRERTREIALAHLAQVESEAFAEFVTAMDGILNVDRHRSLRASLERLSVGSALLANVSRQHVLLMMSVEALLATSQSSLPKEEVAIATAALDRLKTRLRLGDAADRQALAAQLLDVLSDEERENFQAAVARRPVVQRAVNNAFNFVVAKSVESHGTAVGAVLKMIDGKPVVTQLAAPAVLVTPDTANPGFAVVR